MSEIKRYSGLDGLKIICAFFVVCIHTSFGNPTFNDIFTGVARIAVPVFIIITGFFYEHNLSKERRLKQIKKIALITLYASIFYLIFGVVFAYFTKGQNPIEFFKSINTVKSWGRFLLTNVPLSGFHLWYLFALLYVLLIAFLFKKQLSNKILVIIISVLLTVNVLVGEFGTLLLDWETNLYITRNFLFCGIPLFCIGIYLSRKTNNKIKFWGSKISIVCFILLSVVESLICIFNKKIIFNGDCHISTIFLGISVFIMAAQKTNENSKFLNILGDLGKKYSLMIYIIHPMFREIFRYVFYDVLDSQSFIVNLYRNIEPCVIFAISFGTAVLWCWFKNKITVTRNNSCHR